MHKVWSAWCAAICLATAACAATAKEPRGEHLAVVDDTVISGTVVREIEQDPLLARHGIYVETYRGAVQLSGWVATPAQRARAEQIAARVRGVRSVTNEIELDSERAGAPQAGTSAPR